MSIKVDLSKCKGCKLCAKACMYGAIDIVEKKAYINNNCTLCGACVSACKYGAISISKKKKTAFNEGDYEGVWVFAEQKQGKLAGVAFELLGEGRKLADELGVKLSAVLLGEKISDLANELIFYGADRIYIVDNPILKDRLDEPYANTLVQLIHEHKPEIFLAGATSFGRSLIPRVAATLETGLTADCTSLAIDKKNKFLLQTRPAFGGNIMATIICPNKRPQMATVRPKVMKCAQRDDTRSGEIIEETILKPTSLRVKLLDFMEELNNKVNLEEAEIVVAGGRGLGKAENFKLIHEMASILGAAVGASRAAVDAEWIPYSHQVGQTGKTVSPKLYIACGISGAIQHLTGMQTADNIVAINKDPDAPIFNVANYGIVGDLFEIIPAITAKLKEVSGG
ncbi:electron transfer flavoprotein subunit alpha [Candidatus Oleimmundimicrobium sp.]|uniref:electron transfer flavoprotein subunit alpha n=1 Tax=Candidatus Oleimmundimicrobium sp. TaxID=3060597 RepID=UPI002718748C|nr:electron transfer flavoprotein subunit alpha [Candidatus Oleimmundimicrobium sp.]MDO8885352.1 electron transfer flavoprotein subunit alpha [Candidatus Oleimmundimicrobium sp.]